MGHLRGVYHMHAWLYNSSVIKKKLNIQKETEKTTKQEGIAGMVM